MLYPRGQVGLEAKFYRLDLLLDLTVVCLGLVLGLTSCGLVLVTSWPHDLDNSQVDGNYELSTSFSVLSLSP